MRLHPAISIMLAAWFALGGTLGPRFLCSCADGTTTVEFGNRLCCETDNTCCESCNGDSAVDQESIDPAFDAWMCANGCESAPLERDFILAHDRAERDAPRFSPTMVATPFHQLPQARFALPCRGMIERAHSPGLCAAGTPRLRSVILLV